MTKRLFVTPWLCLCLGWNIAFSGCSNAGSSEPSGSVEDDNQAGSGPDDDDQGPPQEGTGGDSNPDDEPSSPQLREVRSSQGAGCNVKNDCKEGFSCIRGTCQPVRFGFAVTGKECAQIDCVERDDCCGHLETEIPEKCRSRASLCLSDLPGCVVEACTRSSDCAGGGVCTGNCSVSSGECTGNADCLENKCVGGSCTINFTDCSSDAECAANTCVGGSCACENPSYDPSSPLCEDEECDGLCLWTCEHSRCVIPSNCEDDTDCFGATPLCDEGNCVACTRSADCSFGKLCIDGRCETACERDAHCPLFEACQKGQCIHVGCRSDRECNLVPSVELLGVPSGTDPRLLRCNTTDGIGRCIIPCQTDAQCPFTEACDGGVCRYIGCETATQCKTILGLHDQENEDGTPWTSRVECQDMTSDE